jgi:putative hydrolase of the HAD superfamily
MGAIRLVTFDFWQTLFADTPQGLAHAHALRLDGVREALARTGRAYHPADLAAADGRALTALEAIWSAHRDVPPAEQVRIVLAALDAALPEALSASDREQVAVAYASAVLAWPPVLSAGAAEAVRELAARGVALGVISNTGRTPGTMLRRLLSGAGIADHFRVLSFSDEVGARKPAAEIFHRTLMAVGVPAGSALHIGDNAAADVGGARAVGMRALHYVPGGAAGAADADALVRHLAELPEILSRF